MQHLSALTRDPVGAYYTNLTDNGKEQKSDMYVRVAELADESKGEYSTRKVKQEDNTVEVKADKVLERYWQNKPISRSMAKNPVMCYLYGSTLLSTIDNIALGMADAGMDIIKGSDGKVIYSMSALATPIGKALRQGVKDTVPEATRMMQYLQNLIRKHKDHTMQWVTPVGVPVVNWAEGSASKKIAIRSMGVENIYMQVRNNEYNTRSAANGIVPNFVHSMDSTHLCMTINDLNSAVLPIHDSVATHACDVDSMHEVLRDTFIRLYLQFKTEDFLKFNNIEVQDFPVPEQGGLDLEDVREARFMFG